MRGDNDAGRRGAIRGGQPLAASMDARSCSPHAVVGYCEVVAPEPDCCFRELDGDCTRVRGFCVSARCILPDRLPHVISFPDEESVMDSTILVVADLGS